MESTATHRNLVVEGIRNVSKVLGMSEVSLLECLDVGQWPVLHAKHSVLVLSLWVEDQSVLTVIAQRTTIRVQHHRRDHGQTVALLLLNLDIYTNDFMPRPHLHCQVTNQPINQLINQSMDLSNNQSESQIASQSINQNAIKEKKHLLDRNGLRSATTYTIKLIKLFQTYTLRLALETENM